MALSGLEIFKKLPKTNCRDCGQPTCLAFAMALASGKAALETCSHLSPEARDFLDSASAPPIALIKIGQGETALEIGDETVLFRHEKKFEHPAGLSACLGCQNDPSALQKRLEPIKALNLDRMGENYRVNLLTICQGSASPEEFCQTVQIVLANMDLPLILKSEQPEVLEKVLSQTSAGAANPLLAGATETNYPGMVKLSQKYDLPLVVKANGLERLADLVAKVQALGQKKIVLDSGAKKTQQVLLDQIQIRRLALRKNRLFGYPTITFAFNPDPAQAVLEAGLYLAKYAGIVVIRTDDPAEVLPLITWRMNLYTDPQKPIAVEAGLYEIGEVKADSPVIVTTNFSLTYFMVAGDIEAARMGAYLLVVETDGVSVLTGWAAGKFTPESIEAALADSGLANKVNHHKLIIPGGVEVLAEPLRKLTGWEVLIGPRESAGLGLFLKEVWQWN
ncbi:MAG: acetyl-CoA decarbonylase/synthase complex subunit gamma [Clostridia bacterium]|nr:acetyl-CoA decarbonylase/synthase complex subunit gamma [Clostridia bacterium]